MFYNRPSKPALLDLDKRELLRIDPPQDGWISAVRFATGVAIERLAMRLDVNKSSVSRLETAERNGTITLGKLRDVASHLDCDVVYYFAPKDGHTFFSIGQQRLDELNAERRKRRTRPTRMQWDDYLPEDESA